MEGGGCEGKPYTTFPPGRGLPRANSLPIALQGAAMCIGSTEGGRWKVWVPPALGGGTNEGGWLGGREGARGVVPEG